MNDTEKKRRAIINIVYYAVLMLIAFLAVRYALGVCLPIFAAFIIATALQRPKNFLTKKTFLKKGSASVVSLFGLLIIISALFTLIGVRAVEEIRGFISYITLQLQNFDVFLSNIENAVMSFAEKLPEFISGTVSESLTTIFTQIREYLAGQNTELTDSITGSLGNSFSFSWITTPLSGVISTAKQIPSILIAIVVCLVASCFMSSDYEEIMGFIKRQFPEKKERTFQEQNHFLKAPF
ncbi:MAG: AI-2E family transporter [Clostridia bacterium]|nr:AI-2E family transporter [Clostridia bacterium]